MARNGPFGQSTARAPQRRQAQEHDPYTAPPTGQGAAQGHWPPAQPGAYPGPAQHGHAPQQGYHFPQPAEPDPNYGYVPPTGQQPAYPPQPGYPPQYAQQQAPQHAPQAQQWGQQQDPGGYDLGSYMPTDGQGFAPAEPAFQRAPEHAAYGGQQQAYGAAQQGYGEADLEYDEALADVEDEPRRGRRWTLIVAALVGAIGLGGALAYTYKTFIASGPGRAPLVKAVDSGANKIKPPIPGGKEFAHTDKKVLDNRLGDERPASEAQDDRASDDPNAPRRVRIIPIQPGGAAPVTTSSAPTRPPVVAVPGLTIDTSGPPPQMPPSAARAQMPGQASPPARPAQGAPVRMASAANTPPPAAEPVAPAKKPTVAPAAAAPKSPVPKAKEASAPAVVAATGSGFVAVLSSQKSRMDALKAFADLQQKYGDVLSARTPDVQEANLGDKGVWYRAVVGPPGSRDAAAGICGQLKTAGYSGCWVTAY